MFSINSWISDWNPGLVGLIVIAFLLQYMITRILPEGRQLLHMHLSMVGLGLLLMLVARALPPLRLGAGTAILGEVEVVGWGVLFIRIAAVMLFRVILPKLNMVTPRIVEDMVFVIVCFGWGLVRLNYAGVNLSGLLTTSAVMTAILAFAMKETLGNVLGGIALQLDNSLEIGDWVTIEGASGKVIEVHWRHTALLTNEGEVVVLPNSLVMRSKFVVFSSASHPTSRRAIKFMISQSVPPSQVIPAVEGAIRAALIDNIAPNPEPHCIIIDYRDGLSHYALRYWIINPQFDGFTDSTVRKHIYTALRRQNISLGRPNVDARLSSNSNQSKARKREEEILDRMQMLSVVKLFAGFHEDELRQIASSLHVTPFTKNDVMTRQGAVSLWLYLLVSGEADVWYEINERERRQINTLGAGAVFGEMGMMTGDVCATTITARTNAVCYCIDKHSFESILIARPALAGELAQIVGERDQELSVVRDGKVLGRAPNRSVDQANILGRIKKFFQLPS